MVIEKVVQEELAKIVESGKVREMIAVSLAKSIQSSIEEALRSYGDFGKALSLKVKDAIGVELGNVNLQTAAIGLGKLVEAQVSRYITEQTHPMLLKQLDDLFQPSPKSISLQALIDAYKDDEASDAADDGVDRCGLVITNDDRSWIRIGLNPKPTKREMNKITYSHGDTPIRDASDCEIQINAMRRDDGTGYDFKWISFNNSEIRKKTTSTFLPTSLYGLSRRLFQMYAAGTVLTLEGMDADDYDTSYPGND